MQNDKSMRATTRHIFILLAFMICFEQCTSQSKETLSLKLSWVALVPPYTTGRAGETVSICMHLRTTKGGLYKPRKIEIFSSSASLKGKPFQKGNAICQLLRITEPKEVSFAIFIDGKLLKRVPRLRLLDPHSPEKRFENPFAYELAKKFAPIVIQKVGAFPEIDRPIPFNFDENMDPLDNWENGPSYKGICAAYFSVITTDTHAFIYYLFYYPRHYSIPERVGFSWENDWTGFMLILERKGIDFLPIALETATYQGFNQYAISPTISPNVEDIEGQAIVWNGHPILEISASEHTPKPITFADLKNLEALYFQGFVLMPDSFTSYNLPVFLQTLCFPYKLFSFFEDIWKQKELIGVGSFEYVKGWELPAFIAGDNVTPNRCQPPWSWDDPDDGSVRIGMWFLDPARTIEEHLNLGKELSPWYTYNLYLGLD